MGKVVASAAVSLDGYIAGPNDTGFEHLFAWFAGGDHEFATTDPNVRFMLSEADHRTCASSTKMPASTSSVAGHSTWPAAGAAPARSESRLSS